MMRNKVLGLVLALGLTAPWVFAREQATDAQRTAEIQDKVYHTKAIEHGQVAATYENGTATLTGTVDNLAAKMDAERAARKVEGVTHVVNNIQVKADDVTPRQILEKARHEVLTYYGYGIFDNIQLGAEGDKLTVSGQVTDPFKKKDLGNILARVRGVAAFENNLEVLPVSSFDDSLRIRVARAIYRTDSFERYGVQAHPPIHIIVKNGNVTLEGAVGSKMDRTLAEMSARSVPLSFSVTNNLKIG